MANVPKKKKLGGKKTKKKSEKVEDEGEDEEVPAEKAPQGEAKEKRSKAQRFDQFLELNAEGSAANEGDASAEPRGVIYLGHIPKGFFEPQMRTFFSQFGKITRMRISRSKRNAQSKGYAFLEFAEESVAKIVADTMNKYLLFGKQLVCHMVPKDKQHPALFKNCKKKMINFSKSRQRKARESCNNRPTVEVDGEQIPQTTIRQAARRTKADKKLRSLLERLEVDFDFDAATTGVSKGGEQRGDGATAAEFEEPQSNKMKRRKAEAEAEAEASVKAPGEVTTDTRGGVSSAASDGAGGKQLPKKKRRKA
jgi:RNA recognition motif-containing protein